MAALTREDALRLLKEHDVPTNVIEHCSSVSFAAKAMAEKAKANGYDVDVEFVESAALLHDIGRAKTHGIRHGLEGATMLAEHLRYARVAECHIGGGITKDEAEKAGLPAKDYVPETAEEKIISYADKLFEGTIQVPFEKTISRFKGELGADHPAIERMIRLEEEVKALIS